MSVTYRSLNLTSRALTYTLKKSLRTKHVRITITRDGAVVVSTPYYVPVRFIEATIADKKDWIFEKVDYFKSLPPKVSTIDTHDSYLKHKEQALFFVQERIKFYNELYHFTWKRVSIKNQKTRWGSCSSDGNLNSNYKLLLLPLHLADYIIVHELCHLEELNHGANFWNLVEKTIPNYKEARKELRSQKFLNIL